MAKFQVLHKYFFIFLVLVVCHGSLLAHGRKINIKPLNQQHSLLNTKIVANNPNPSLPSLKTKVESPEHFEEASKLGDSGADTNAFRPTTPRGSPSVGHKMITPSEDNKMKTMVLV